ncbi:hypothetical protein SCE1572_13260 [Sorangium cellulosum So0157-2]|nr:hypothetical protein SCE1572_13260 [Sorangium cellulosum So0157-2]
MCGPSGSARSRAEVPPAPLSCDDEFIERIRHLARAEPSRTASAESEPRENDARARMKR